MIDIQM